MFVFTDTKANPTWDARTARVVSNNYYILLLEKKVELKSANHKEQEVLKLAKDVGKNRLVDYISKKNLKLNPCVALYQVYPKLYQNTGAGTKTYNIFDGDKIVPPTKGFAAHTFDANTNILSKYTRQIAPQLIQRRSNTVDINSFLSKDEASNTKGDLLLPLRRSNELDDNKVKRLYKFLLTVLYDVIIDLFPNHKDEILDSRKTFTVLGELWLRETFQSVRESQTTDAYAYFAYFNVYDVKDLKKSSITNFTPSNITAADIKSKFSDTLNRYFNIFSDQEPDLETDNPFTGEYRHYIYGRYIYHLFSLVLDRPIINSNNKQNYKMDDLYQQIIHNDQNTALADVISLEMISPSFINQTTSFDEWKKRVFTPVDICDYNLAVFEGSKDITTPRVQLIDSNSRLQFLTRDITVVNSSKDYKQRETELHNIGHIAHMCKLFSKKHNLKGNPFKELFNERYKYVTIYGPKANRAGSVHSLKVDIRDELNSINKSKVYFNQYSVGDDKTLYEKLTDFTKKVSIENITALNSLPVKYSSDIQLKDYLELKLKSVFKEYYEAFIHYYRANKINTPYLTQKSVLYNIIKSSVNYDGVGDTLSIFDDILRLDIYYIPKEAIGSSVSPSSKILYKCLITKNEQAIILYETGDYKLVKPIIKQYNDFTEPVLVYTL